MDYFGYRETFKKSGKTPGKRIVARRGRWDVGTGMHPYLISGKSPVWEVDPFAADGSPRVSPEWQSDPRGVIDGHNVMTDNGFLSLLDVDHDVPISPLFVRDLAGRAIYTGPGPERKDIQEWESYHAGKEDKDGELLNPLLPLVVFPRRCWPASRVAGSEWLERVFFTKFRTLDMGKDFVEAPSGANGNPDMAMRAEYRLANLYPYKYRMDTFYVDGWKLPQTQMLYAAWEGIKPERAREAGLALMAAWEGRPAGQDYEAWVEAQGGEGWIEKTFAAGCTLIPTFEAYNGLNVVSAGFGLEDVWPGRAVGGLHEVVERRADKAPPDTILEVVQPGYVTATAVHPAKVVVSDGSNYVSPNAADPAPLIPNLFLPHQRTLDNWEATWIPTHPGHFEMPALWGWDLSTGRFLQFTGPLWDPLHYHYACLEVVRKAVKNPLPVEENRWFVPVPEEMQERFYPVVPMKGFDVVAFEAQDRRIARASLPRSAVTHIAEERESCGIGYHPLPMEFEYEIDPYWFPEFHPQNREHGLCPDDLQERICPVIVPKVTPEHYADAIEADDAYPWLADLSMLATPGEHVLDNYPFLVRYLVPDLDANLLEEIMPLPFLGEVGDQRLAKTPRAFWSGVDEMDDLEAMAHDLHEAVWDIRDMAFETMRTRHLIYRSSQHLYRFAWWTAMLPGVMEGVYLDRLEEEAEDKTEDGAAVVPAKPVQAAFGQGERAPMPAGQAAVEGE